MNCRRCENNIPDFLWIGDDHPVVLDYPINIYREDLIENNMVKIVAETKVQMKMCSDVIAGPVNPRCGLCGELISMLAKEANCSFPQAHAPEKIFDWTTLTPIETAVGEAIGAVSACWENLSGAGIFESTRAKQIVDELVAYIKSKQPIY